MTEQRKLVTVLFADVVGSTSLAAERDPEVVRAVMGRYFDRMRGIAEEHGGTVEKFAGDAVMVVFGVPRVHDDDAERAVRAALAMTAALEELNSRMPVSLQLRIGINSGEAVASAGEGREFMVSGDVVNVAARLQQGAEAGEIVAGGLTHDLTAAAFEYAPARQVEAKGKSEPLTAHPVLRATSALPEQKRGLPGLTSPLIGRDRELRMLLDAHGRALEDGSPCVFTIIGAPGVGKSRLVAEGVGRLQESGVAVLRGRCLPYGSGITWWPYAEVVRDDTGILLDDAPGAALEKLDRRLETLGASDRQALRARLAVILGLQEPGAALPDIDGRQVHAELAWGFRRYVELLAAPGAVLVLDDLQWGEDPLLDAVEQMADHFAGGALLLICAARPEFLDRRAGWGGGRLNASTIVLNPLTPEQTASLISSLLDVEDLPAALKQRVVLRSEGVPLYCEEFLRMLLDGGRIVRDGDVWRAAGAVEDVAVPPTIQALLAARLDALEAQDRQLLQAASIVGERFARRELEGLTDRPGATERLAALRRGGFLASDPEAPDQFRFRHLLIRDAAYASLPKAARADHHEAFARLLAARPAAEQVGRIVAHHSERALTLSRELLLDGPELERRARLALEWALLTGEEAIGYQDVSALKSAAATATAAIDALGDLAARSDRARARLLAAAVPLLTGDFPTARSALSAAAADAEAAGLGGLAARAYMHLFWTEAVAGSGPDLERSRLRALEAARAAGDESVLVPVEFYSALGLWHAGRVGDFAEALRALAVRARDAQLPAVEAEILQWLAMAASHLGEALEARGALERARQLIAEHGLRSLELWQAVRETIEEWRRTGDPEPYIAALRTQMGEASDTGNVGRELPAARNLTDMLIDLGRHDEARDVLPRAVDLAESTGERWSRSELLANAAYCSAMAGDEREAERLLEESEALVRDYQDIGDPTASAHRLQRLGAIRAAQGRSAEAEAAFRTSVEIMRGTEVTQRRLFSELAYARFLAAEGRRAEAEEILAAAEAWLARTEYRYLDAEIAAVRDAAAASAG